MAYGDVLGKGIKSMGGAKSLKGVNKALRGGARPGGGNASSVNRPIGKSYTSGSGLSGAKQASKAHVEGQRIKKISGDSAFNTLPKNYGEMAPKYQKSAYEHTVNTKFPKAGSTGNPAVPTGAKIGKRVAGDNHPSALQKNMDLAMRNGYSPGMDAAKKAGGDHLDMIAGKFADSNARFGANGGWGGVGGAALRGAVVGGLGNGTFEAAQGGSFWDGAKSGAFYGAAGTAGFRVAKQRTGAKTYFGKDGIRQTNARRNQAYGIMDGDKNTGAGVRALLGNQATAKMVSAANGLQR